MTQTLLTSRNGSDLREYPVSEQKTLKDKVFDYGLGPRIIVYGYILNRNDSFRNKFYNWGTQRIVPKGARDEKLDKKGCMSKEKTVEVGERAQFGMKGDKIGYAPLIDQRDLGKFIPMGARGETLSERIIQQWFAGDTAPDLRRLADVAPELLKIAQAMLVVGDHIDISQGVRMRDIFFGEFKSLDAAIAKAEGK